MNQRIERDSKKHIMWISDLATTPHISLYIPSSSHQLEVLDFRARIGVGVELVLVLIFSIVFQFFKVYSDFNFNTILNFNSFHFNLIFSTEFKSIVSLQ